MTERAAHLVDYVFPRVLVRQWVLSLPPPIRYLLAWDHALCRAVVAVFVRAVLGSLRHRARLAPAADGRGGGVAIVQRFGAALNLNVHVHALVMDGVFVADGAGGVRFRPARPMGDDELAALLATIERRTLRLLTRRGGADGSEGFDTPDRWSEDAPLLAGLAAASVRGVRALGPRAGAPVRRWGDPIDAPEPPPLGRWQRLLSGAHRESQTRNAACCTGSTYLRRHACDRGVTFSRREPADRRDRPAGAAGRARAA